MVVELWIEDVGGGCGIGMLYVCGPIINCTVKQGAKNKKGGEYGKVYAM